MQQEQSDSPRQKGQASAQISITRAPWAESAPPPARASGSLPRAVSGPLRKPSNPESLQWQEKAPWAVDGPSMPAGIDAMPAMPQAPTRAPWADGGAAGFDSDNDHLPHPSSPGACCKTHSTPSSCLILYNYRICICTHPWRLTPPLTSLSDTSPGAKAECTVLWYGCCLLHFLCCATASVPHTWSRM